MQGRPSTDGAAFSGLRVTGEGEVEVSPMLSSEGDGLSEMLVLLGGRKGAYIAGGLIK